jgi:hypothetical protein
MTATSYLLYEIIILSSVYYSFDGFFHFLSVNGNIIKWVKELLITTNTTIEFESGFKIKVVILD